MTSYLKIATVREKATCVFLVFRNKFLYQNAISDHSSRVNFLTAFNLRPFISFGDERRGHSEKIWHTETINL
jgi:hypothetical protein